MFCQLPKQCGSWPVGGRPDKCEIGVKILIKHAKLSISICSTGATVCSTLLLCGFLSLPFLLFWKGCCCRYGCWCWGFLPPYFAGAPFSKKHRKSLGSCPGRWRFGSSPPPCLTPVTLANAFSSSSFLAALSRKIRVLSWSLALRGQPSSMSGPCRLGQCLLIF